MTDTILLWLIMIFAGTIMLILFVDWISDYRSGYFSDKEKEKEMMESARKSQEKRLINDRMYLNTHLKTSSFSSSQKEETLKSKGSK